MPVATTEQVWRLRLQGSGKAAFWLDGTANLFAQNPQQLKPLREDAGQTRLTLHKEVLGKTPNLGIALPYVMPPPASYAVLDALKPTGRRVTTALSTSRRRSRTTKMRSARLYQDRFGIKQDITLLAGSQRQADLRADATATPASMPGWPRPAPWVAKARITSVLPMSRTSTTRTTPAIKAFSPAWPGKCAAIRPMPRPACASPCRPVHGWSTARSPTTRPTSAASIGRGVCSRNPAIRSMRWPGTNG